VAPAASHGVGLWHVLPVHGVGILRIVKGAGL